MLASLARLFRTSSSSRRSSMAVPYISGDALAARLKDAAASGSGARPAIVDVRDADFAGGHIVGARNVPSEEFHERVEGLVQSLAQREWLVEAGLGSGGSWRQGLALRRSGGAALLWPRRAPGGEAHLCARRTTQCRADVSAQSRLSSFTVRSRSSAGRRRHGRMSLRARWRSSSSASTSCRRRSASAASRARSTPSAGRRCAFCATASASLASCTRCVAQAERGGERSGWGEAAAGGTDDHCEAAVGLHAGRGCLLFAGAAVGLSALFRLLAGR
jgi:hypothetical protein